MQEPSRIAALMGSFWPGSEQSPFVLGNLMKRWSSKAALVRLSYWVRPLGGSRRLLMIACLSHLLPERQAKCPSGMEIRQVDRSSLGGKLVLLYVNCVRCHVTSP